ncbi:MAG: DUF4421 family protein [Chryseolinea sp.]
MARQPFILILMVVCLVIASREAVYAQKKTVKEQMQENVFLHPKLFYKKFFPHMKIKRDPPDSAYIKVYPHYLSVSAHVLRPAIGLDIFPGNSSGNLKYRTNIRDILGFSGSYKFVGVGFAFLLNSGAHSPDEYTKSRYRTATIKYNSKGWSLQYKYLRFKGLTDIGRPSGMDPSIGFIKRPDIVNKEFQFEGLYNPAWQKYSYVAPLTFSQRQVKSRVGFLLKTGVYYSQMSGDTSLVAPGKAKYYGDFKDIKAIRSLSIRLAPGVGGNIVFLRQYYFSLVAFPSYDLYLYKYLKDVDEKVKGKQAFIFGLDGKASLGYQSKRIYGGLRFEFERRSASLSGIDIRAMYTYLGVEFGYRFNAPKIVKKVYKDTMPPGM